MVSNNLKHSVPGAILALLLLTLAVVPAKAQTVLTPGNTSFDRKWLKNGKQEMTCYVLNGTQKTAISTFVIEINTNKNHLSVYTALYLPGSNKPLVDTSIANIHTFKPVYRSSYNQSREYVLHYGQEVSGYYLDKKSQKKSLLKETVKESFFDSYVYPYLLGLLPLASGYQAEMAVYDYKPEHNGNIKKTLIEEVKSNRYISNQSGPHDTWQVSVYEQATREKYEYYIDKVSRKIWKIEIFTGNQHLLLEDKEPEVNPFKNSFNKEETLKLVKSGSAVIRGQAFARDNKNGGLLRGMAVLNVNKKQYALHGTSIVLIPYTPFFKEWVKLNEESRKKGKSVPLPPEAAACIKVASVYDDEGYFEFVNLMPGDYLVFTEFGFMHDYSESEVTGYTDTYINGLFQGSTEHTISHNYTVEAKASVQKVVTIKEPGARVDVKLKQTL